MEQGEEQGESQLLTRCALWKDARKKLAGGLQAEFELVSTLVKESHWWQYVLKCRGCGQLYLMEFFEEVDWADSEDPQYTTWIPLKTMDGAERPMEPPFTALRLIVPRLCKDYPKGEEIEIYWVTGDDQGEAALPDKGDNGGATH